MAEQSAFLTAYDEMQKKKREQEGFSAPAPMESVVDTVGQAPAVQSPFSQAAAPNPMEVAVDPQPDLVAAPAVQASPAPTQNGAMIGVPDFDAPYIYPEAARAFGDVPVNMPSNPLDSNAQISAAQDRLPSTPSEVIPRGGIRTRGTGGTQPQMAASRTGGIAEAEVESGFLDTFRTVINPSQEQQALNLAGGRTGGIQALPPEAPVVEMATPESVANLLVNGADVVTPGAITDVDQVAPATLAPQAQLPSTIQNANGQDLIGFKPKYEGQSLTDFMAGRDDPSAASVQVQDPQGRFRRQAAPVEGETPEQNQARTDALFPEQADFQQASADREARQAARPDFGEAVSDRERRAARGEGMSDADRRDIAKAQSPDASESERARGMKVAEKAGLDWRTGQPLKQDKETGGLTDYQAITAKQRQAEIDMKIAEGMEEKEAKRVVAYEESRNNVRSTQDSFDKLKPVAKEIALLSGSKFTEGVLGWTASKLPFSTDAAQIERLTTEFEGSAFLQGLIDAKAKGATFGALSEREGDRILGQWGKITSPKSTNEERIKSINSMLESIQRSSERAESDHREKFPELSSRSVEPKPQGSTKGKRYADDQDYGAKVETYYKG
jgi:hypothetical protein